MKKPRAKKPRAKKPKRAPKPVVTVRRMGQERALCFRLRMKGDAASLAKANKIESEWKHHPDYDPVKFKKAVGLFAQLTHVQKVLALAGIED